MKNGEYCTIGAEIDAQLKTHYVIKVGETCGYLSERADVQRLKLVWGHKKSAARYLGRRYGFRHPCEKEIKHIARSMFGAAKIDYRPGGITEMFGHFATAHEANEAAWKLLWALQADPRFSEDEFWSHPEAVEVGLAS